MALETAECLNAMGLATELSVVGCLPRFARGFPDYVKVWGFLDKTTEDGLRMLSRLFADSHFLIMPSKAECYGVVLSEANAFGVPVLVTPTGGMRTIVREGVNGRTFSLSSFSRDCSQFLETLFRHETAYRQMALGAFDEYRFRLNWKTAGETVRNFLMEIMEGSLRQLSRRSLSEHGVVSR